MGVYLPIVVAAPAGRRELLLRSGVLPQHWFRDISTELWETDPDSPRGKSTPSIYLWPYDVPYWRSEELRKNASDRVVDLPAFFGMPQDDEPGLRAHQECMLTPVLFGSVVVHVVFLDNSKTDTTPGFEERNETYAQFDTFGKIIKWTEDFKAAMNYRFPNNRGRSRHILLLVSPGQQVITTKDEIQDLNRLIGKEGVSDELPFCACYFLNEHLEPGQTGELYHSENIWDLLVSRFLLFLLLTQEEENNWLTGKINHGVNVWRAEDCIIPLAPDSSRVEKEELEKASQKLLELVSEQADQGGLRLLTGVEGAARNQFTCPLVPSWESAPGKKAPDYKEWAENSSATQAVPTLTESFRRNWSIIFRRDWSSLPVTGYENEIKSPGHWRAAFEELRKGRIDWSAKNPQNFYASDLGLFFARVHQEPQTLGSLTDQLAGELDKTRDALQKNENDPSVKWQKLFTGKDAHRQALKRLAEDSKEFQKAQNYYVGIKIGLLVMAVVTGFAGWMIGWSLSLFGVGILKILLLFAMVFAGAAAAYLLVMLLHNFTGHRAAVKVMAECKAADDKMVERDGLVREVFFGGIEKRNILTFQCVRFRTWHLANRLFSILAQELQPQLSSLIDEEEEAEPEQEVPDPRDPYRVRKAYLRRTRTRLTPVGLDTKSIWTKPEAAAPGTPNNGVEEFAGNFKTESDKLIPLLTKLCDEEDKEGVGYFPARKFIDEISRFVSDFLKKIRNTILEKSIAAQLTTLGGGFETFAARLQKIDDESLLSAPLASWTSPGEDSVSRSGSVFHDSVQAKILFVHPQFYSKPASDKQKRTIELMAKKSELLKETRIAALYYHEFRVEFHVQERDDSSGRGDLIFMPIKSKDGVAVQKQDDSGESDDPVAGPTDEHGDGSIKSESGE